jgi:5-aminolevulinate synthase
MGQHPKVIGAMVETATRMGTGAGGMRNIVGTSHLLVELERELADLHGKATLVFTSGYVSNQTGIATIATLMCGCVILSDALNHNSMIEGVRQRAPRNISGVITVSELPSTLSCAGAGKGEAGHSWHGTLFVLPSSSNGSWFRVRGRICQTL